MNPEEKIETQLEQLAQAIGSGDSFVDNVMSRLETSSDNLQKQPHHNLVRRLFMKPLVKFAAAAIILIAALLSLTLFDKTVATAYALEETINALHSVRFIHMRQYNPAQQEPISIWAEFFDNGQPKSIRLNMPDWASGGDGAKDIIWKDNVAQVWFKKKNGFLRVREQKLADDILNTVRENDPKSLVQNLMHKKESGECELRIDQPADKTQPICVTAIILPDKNKKLVLDVDQATQLPLSLEIFLHKDGQYSLESTIEFYDYNQPIDPTMFIFGDLPADTMKVDQVKNAVGLEQGKLTNDEVAIEVVRRFWQAIIDGDYETASRMYDGTPAETLKNVFAEKFKDKSIKILSVGPVKPHPNPKTRGVIVPCVLEVEGGGQKAQFPLDRIGVRQVYNQPGRWTIFGGI